MFDRWLLPGGLTGAAPVGAVEGQCDSQDQFVAPRVSANALDRCTTGGTVRAQSQRPFHKSLWRLSDAICATHRESCVECKVVDAEGNAKSLQEIK
jgi:hypothetical protein